MSATEKLGRDEVRQLVEKYRRASGAVRRAQARKLRRGPDSPQFGQHVDTLWEVPARLENNGHTDIAGLLKQWHGNLKAWNTDHAWSRSLADQINRTVEAIR